MKVLIISDEDELIFRLNSFFTNNGVDTICYKWLLKALDNIEEIQPNLIILSSREYPRHWKTLVQFVKSGIGGENVKVYLYEPEPLEQEDENKAKALGITNYFTNYDTSNLYTIFSEDILKINKIVNIQQEIDDDLPSVDSILQKKIERKIILTNPVHKNFVTGIVQDVNNNRFEVKLDSALVDVANNDFIDFITYYDMDDCFSFSAEIYILNKEDNIVILTLKDKYEEI